MSTEQSKWTPGPWRVRDIDRSLGSVETVTDGIVVAQAGQVRPTDRDTNHVERKANAHLIAAAPELYEALEKMCRFHEIMGTWDKGDNGYYAAKNAIRKARGES